MVARRRCNPGNRSVRLNVPDEHLMYIVTVSGAKGIFTLADTQGKVLLSDRSTPISSNRFERKWPRGQSELPDQASILHTLGMQFIAALSYGYRVEKRDRQGNVLSVVKDCTFESSKPEDTRFEALRVRIQR